MRGGGGGQHEVHISRDLPVRSLLHSCLSPAVACPSALEQLLNVHVELGDLVGPRLTMQASLSTDIKLLIGIRKTGNNQDNDGLGLFNAQMPLQTAEGF